MGYESNVVVIGLGEIGRPLLEILRRSYNTYGKDVGPIEVPSPVSVLHICYPFQIADFVGSTIKYIDEFKPSLTIIHSTVQPGTTESIAKRVSSKLAYSPVRGKHFRMEQDLIGYAKFVASNDPSASQEAAVHLENAGMRIQIMNSYQSLELAKLLETSYFGLLIAWAQEMERYCRELGCDYSQVMQFMDEIEIFPPVIYQPGFIGGHCVIPNTHLLDRVRRSCLIDAIRVSNEIKRAECDKQGNSLSERVAPIPKQKMLEKN